MIVQGDQRYITFTINGDEKEITPDDIQGLKVKINNKIYEYPSDISYENDKWKCFISQDETLDMKCSIPMAIQVNFGGNPAVIKTSKQKTISIEKGIIKEVW